MIEEGKMQEITKTSSPEEWRELRSKHIDGSDATAGSAEGGQAMLKIIIADRSVEAFVRQNDGYCPCAIERTPDTKCMCKEFREQDAPGKCHCGLYEKVEDNKDNDKME